MWRARTVAAVGLAGVLVATAVGAAALVVGVQLTHPRDTAAYIDYLHTYGSTTGEQLVDLPPAADLVAAGDHACDWLAGQTWALWRTDVSRRVSTLQARYENEFGDEPTGWGAAPARDAVLAAAWAYLCPATLELRRPHWVVGAPQD